MNSNQLNSFLKFGYFLDYSDSKFKYKFDNVDKNKYINASENELIDKGVKILKESVRKLYRENEKHVVPLSGGLDSRAILSCLLEHTEAKNIKTYTFGSKGTLDYEIGNELASIVGTDHESIALDEYEFTMNDLINTSKKMKHQTVLFSTIPLKIIEDKFSGYTHWTGAFAGPPTGNILLSNPSANIIEAKRKFLNHKYTHVKSINLVDPDYNNLLSQLDIDFVASNIVTLDEQLHMNFAQKKWIEPHVLLEGFNYAVPFMDKDWIEYMFSLDNDYRINQNIYKKILLKAFPELFMIRTKSNFGLGLDERQAKVYLSRILNKVKRNTINKSRKFVDPYTNYIDFGDGIRNREDINSIFKNNIIDLKNRNIIDWLDIEQILEDHLNNKKDYSDALKVLVSLEIHIKAGVE